MSGIFGSRPKVNGIDFGVERWLIYIMQKRGRPTCVAPGIPSDCLHNLAGWLLPMLVDCRTINSNGELITCFYVDESNYQAANIDAAFIKCWVAEPDISNVKAALIAENECLSAGHDLTIGTEIKIATLDLNALFQRLVAHARCNPTGKQFSVLYTAGFVEPKDFVGRCMLITADEITSISYEDWLIEKASGRPQLNASSPAA